jgi:hypothetical protein
VLAGGSGDKLQEPSEEKQLQHTKFAPSCKDSIWQTLTQRPLQPALHAAGLPTVKTRVAVTPDPVWPAPDPQHDKAKRKQQLEQEQREQPAAAAGSAGSKKGRGRPAGSKKGKH